MFCITIEEGNDYRQLFYYSKEKAVLKIRKLLEDEINKYVDEGYEMHFDEHIPTRYLETILKTFCQCKFGDDEYDDYKYEVTISKMNFEDTIVVY